MWIPAFVAFIGFILGVSAQNQDLVIRVNEGERVEINMAFPNNPNPSKCTWKNERSVIPDDDNYQTTIENGRCKLVIARVTFKEDNGLLIGSISENEQQRIQVQVTIPLTLFTDKPAADEHFSLYKENLQEAQNQDLVIRVNEGERVEINMAFPNNPNPSKCTWKNERSVIPDDDNYQTTIENGRCKLVIARVTFKEDNGLLIGSISENEQQRIQVQVTIPLTLFTDKPAADEHFSLYKENHQEAQNKDLVIRVNEGERVEINVAFSSNPNPSQCTWKNKHSVINDNDNYQTRIENGRCKLIIAYVNFKRDDGLLVSSVSNEEQQRIQVQVGKSPSYKLQW